MQEDDESVAADATRHDATAHELAESERAAESASDRRDDAPAERNASDAEASAKRWRRLHTASGAIVLGAFLVAHLATNASALGGASRYDAVVGAIARSKALTVLELLVLVPLAFHAGSGLRLLRGAGRPDAEIDRYGDRRLWVLQRISATLVLAFVLFHLWELRVQRAIFGLSPDALHTVVTAHLSWTWGGVPWVALLYLLGLAATVLHLSNGLFAATAAWGVATSLDGRRRVRAATVALGALLFLTGGATVIALATGTTLLPAADDTNPCGSAVPKAATPARP